VADAGVCLKAMRYVAMVDGLFIQHCEDKTLSAGGCMNAGVTATRLGLPGLSNAAEDVMVQRDILLAEIAGARYHVAHVSTAGSVEMVRRAKAAGRPVSTEVCPHHLLLADEACATYDTRFKMSPPLRSAADVRACIDGVLDGTIDCLVTDHAPHAEQDKQQEFQSAPFGIIGLETALGLFAKALVGAGLAWPRLIELMSTAPARLMKVELGTLRAGAPADVTLIDPEAEWTFEATRSRSRSRNTPFDGWKLPCRAKMTIVGGEVRYNAMGSELPSASSAPSG
jgi:dihydroorotase